MRTLAEYQRYVEAKRIIPINGEFSSSLVDEWRERRDKVLDRHPKGEIAIALNSIGGSISDALVIYHEIRALASVAERTVWLVCQGSIQSMTVYVSMAINVEHRVAFPNTTFYLHRIKNSVQIEDEGEERTETINRQTVAVDKYDELEVKASLNHSPILERQLRNFVVRGTKLSSAEVASLIDKNLRNISVTEARRLGFISRILK